MDWNEIIEKLEQKAWLHGRTAKGKEPICSMYPNNVGYAVWLEDVKEALQQLQENYIIIEKKKFKDEIVCGQLSTNAIINDLHEKIEEIIKNFVSFKASFIEELLKE